MVTCARLMIWILTLQPGSSLNLHDGRRSEPLVAIVAVVDMLLWSVLGALLELSGRVTATFISSTVPAYVNPMPSLSFIV